MKLLGALLLTVCVGASAAEPWYVGADVGVTSNNTREGNNGRFYLGYELGTTQTLGMTQTHALEAQLYQFNFRRSETLYGYTYVDHVRAKGGALAWATGLQVSDKFALNARLGVAYTQAKVRSNDGGDWGPTYSKVSPLASLGASYALSDNLKLRADLSYMKLQTGYHYNIDHALLSVGLAYKF